ncbi:GrpB family protein [Bacillus carboniphilus]|uniref:GrpB family protein n=1 Tax=Bacillus carboniphilus TaxID=86663 RepID=A0ABY9JX54_9BACI|nr:GrpB family protein [Bacillus carboniphilus]WLR43082.1 GrpB family protein [Bacillus carboniphilus]
MRIVVVEPYNKNWLVLFEQEARMIKPILESEVVKIYHIGSTSVPGLSAKPILDLMPVVKNIHRVDAFNEEFKAIGYDALGENGIKNRRFFRKGGDDRTHHLHVFQLGSPEIERHLAFRDYLIAHPLVANEYGKLKGSLAKKYPNDIDQYMAGKHDFIVEAEKKGDAVVYKSKECLNIIFLKTLVLIRKL